MGKGQTIQTPLHWRRCTADIRRIGHCTCGHLDRHHNHHRPYECRDCTCATYEDRFLGMSLSGLVLRPLA